MTGQHRAGSLIAARALSRSVYAPKVFLALSAILALAASSPAAARAS